jgi:hypothetical protein
MFQSPKWQTDSKNLCDDSVARHNPMGTSPLREKWVFEDKSDDLEQPHCGQKKGYDPHALCMRAHIRLLISERIDRHEF